MAYSSSPVVVTWLLLLLLSLVSSSSALNCTIVDGVVTSSTSSALLNKNVGVTSSSLMAFITANYPTTYINPVPSLVTPSNLNYLTLRGAYSADVPLVLPSFFFLVLQGASLTAIPSFVPANNQVSPEVSKLAVVVADSTVMNGVLGVGPRDGNVIDCADVPNGAGAFDPTTGSTSIGPPGIYFYKTSNNVVDSITVNDCGYGNGNIFVHAANYVEIANSAILKGRTRGVWMLTPSMSVVHHCEVSFSGK